MPAHNSPTQRAAILTPLDFVPLGDGTFRAIPRKPVQMASVAQAAKLTGMRLHALYLLYRGGFIEGTQPAPGKSCSTWLPCPSTSKSPKHRATGRGSVSNATRPACVTEGAAAVQRCRTTNFQCIPGNAVALGLQRRSATPCHRPANNPRPPVLSRMLGTKLPLCLVEAARRTSEPPINW